MSKLVDKFSHLSKDYVDLQSQHEQLKQDLEQERTKLAEYSGHHTVKVVL